MVIVNYNSAPFIGAFLDSLACVDYANARLVVVDSASSDGSLSIIEQRRADAAIIRCNENVGTARGNNLGAQHCLDHNYDYVLFLNDDTTHEPDFLRTLVEAANERTMTVPRILYSEDHR